MGAIAGRSFAVAMVSAFCVAGVAMAAGAPVAPADVQGRWVSQRLKLTLDISRCGEGWCGVEVKSDATCGGTALRMDGGKPDGERRATADDMEFRGRLELAANTQPYTVRADLVRKDGALGLHIAGHTGGEFLMFRRTYDFHGVFARSGDPVCRPDPKLS